MCVRYDFHPHRATSVLSGKHVLAIRDVVCVRFMSLVCTSIRVDGTIGVDFLMSCYPHLVLLPALITRNFLMIYQ